MVELTKLIWEGNEIINVASSQLFHVTLPFGDKMCGSTIPGSNILYSTKMEQRMIHHSFDHRSHDCDLPKGDTTLYLNSFQLNLFRVLIMLKATK